MKKLGMKSKLCAAILICAAGINHEIITGGVINWKDVSLVSKDSYVYKINRSFGFLSVTQIKGEYHYSSRCTATVIDHNKIITNMHCADPAVPTIFKFYPDFMVAGDMGESFSCPTMLRWSEELDYMVLECEELPMNPIALESEKVEANEEVLIIHQNCDYPKNKSCKPVKKFEYCNLIGREYNKEIKHNCDTLGGSSGSSILSAKTGKIIALHHVGVGGDALGRGQYNAAEDISEIYKEIKDILPNYDELSILVDSPSTDVVTIDPIESERPSFFTMLWNKIKSIFGIK